MSKSNVTGERLEFYDFSNVTVEHLHRYAIANIFVCNKIVLDIASGEGYGSYLLSKNALKVIGVDIDLVSVNNANKKYSKNNLKFLEGSADKIPLEDNSVDFVVSFETIEHHDKHNEMLLEIKRVLKEDGILIMSSPDKRYYSDLTGQVNPFHIKELYFDEFKKLIDQNFSFTNYYYQNSFNLNSFIGNSVAFSNYKIYSGDEHIIKENLISPIYNIVVASNLKSHNVENSFFDGNEISQRLNKNLMEALEENLLNRWRKTNTFMIGNLVIYPFFILKKKFKKIFFLNA